MLLRHIRYLLAVAEHQNFTRAAEALHVSQPTLSQQIRQMEDVLGAQLFDRSGRTVRLTDAGEIYVRFARRALQDLDAGKRAIHDVKDLARGSVRLAITPTFTAYLVGALVEPFNSRYPGISLYIKEMPQDQMEAALAEDELDIGIAFSEVRSPEIESQPLFVETLSMMVSSLHQHGVTDALSMTQLEEQPLVLLSGDFATRRYIDEYFHEHKIVPRVAVEANSITAIVEIVRRSHLATILPDAISQEQTGLISVQLTPTLRCRTAALLVRRDAYRSAASEAFMNIAKSWGQKSGSVRPLDSSLKI